VACLPREVVRAWLTTTALFLLCGTGILQGAFRDPLTLYSRSRQFIVSGIPLRQIPFTGSTSVVSFVRLDPSLVAVSCESIKEVFLRELGLTDQWKGSIALNLHPVRQDDEPIEITSLHFQKGWRYRLDIPETVNRPRFLEAIVQVLLLELANRDAGAREAELPPWLAEGMARHLQATSLAGLALEPGQWSELDVSSRGTPNHAWKVSNPIIARKKLRGDPLATVRISLRDKPPLNIDQLNWPTDELLSEDPNSIYGNCAHLLVHELFRLRNGRSCMLSMIQQLHNALNWQTSFFGAFGQHFPRLIDLDKWWALRVVQISQRELFSFPRAEEQWRQIEAVLQTRAADTHSITNRTPARAQLTLQDIITDWEYPDQQAFLSQKITQLKSAAASVPGQSGVARGNPRAPESLPALITEYTSTLGNYLRKRDAANRATGHRNDPSINVPSLIENTINHLNDLDNKRDQLKRSIFMAEGNAPKP